MRAISLLMRVINLGTALAKSSIFVIKLFVTASAFRNGYIEDHPLKKFFYFHIMINKKRALGPFF